MFCENCGAQLREGAAFCENCGSKVNVAPVQPAPAPVNAPASVEPPVAPPVVPPQVSDTVIPPVAPPQATGSVIPPMNTNNAGYQPPFTPPVNPGSYGEPVQRPAASVGIVDAIKDYFSRYADFKGRTVRGGYWWATIAVSVISGILGSVPALRWVSTLFALAILIPGLAVCVRRLHDVGKSGKTLLWLLLPLVGWIYLIVQYVKVSAGDNQWGLAPEEYKNNPAQM